MDLDASTFRVALRLRRSMPVVMSSVAHLSRYMYMPARLLVVALVLGHLSAAQTVIECREPGLSIRFAGPTSRGTVLERDGKGSWDRLACNGSKTIAHGTHRTFALLDMLSAQIALAYHRDAGRA
jgi:hypothetical protein